MHQRVGRLPHPINPRAGSRHTFPAQARSRKRTAIRGAPVEPCPASPSRRPANGHSVATMHASVAPVDFEILALSLEKFRWKTEGDFAALENLFDDDMVFVHLTGDITTKAEWMLQLRAGTFRYDRIEPHEATVSVYGSTAVLVGKALFEVNGGIAYPLVYTEVYTRKSGDWKLVNLHTTLDH